MSQQFLHRGRPSMSMVLGLLWLVLPAHGATDRPVIEEVMERVARQVEKFSQDLPSVTCKETMVQTKLDDRGKQIEERQTTYDYTMSLAMEGIGMAIEESRVSRDNVATKPKHSLLVSEGFSTLLLIFHPHFQPSFRFELVAGDELQDPHVLRIQFEHREGTPTPSILQTHGGDVPIEWKGIAWVDAQSWKVVRIQARLKKPLEVLGIKDLTSDVAYAITELEGSNHSYLLPQSAVIEARTTRQQWRNVHRFNAYRRFAVDTELKFGIPE